MEHFSAKIVVNYQRKHFTKTFITYSHRKDTHTHIHTLKFPLLIKYSFSPLFHRFFIAIGRIFLSKQYNQPQNCKYLYFSTNYFIFLFNLPPIFTLIILIFLISHFALFNTDIMLNE